jgi:hypothetical protein
VSWHVFRILIIKRLPILDLAIKLTILICGPTGSSKSLFVTCQAVLDETTHKPRSLPRRNDCLKPMGHGVRYRKGNPHNYELCFMTYDCQGVNMAQVNIEECKLTTEDTEITEDKDRRWHSLCEWGG